MKFTPKQRAGAAKHARIIADRIHAAKPKEHGTICNDMLVYAFAAQVPLATMMPIFAAIRHESSRRKIGVLKPLWPMNKKGQFQRVQFLRTLAAILERTEDQ